MMGMHILSKTVKVNGVGIVLRSLDGTNWSSDLKDLERVETGRKARRATVQKSFRTIGANSHWGLGRGKKRRRAG